MDVNDNAYYLNERAALESTASKLAPTIEACLRKRPERQRKFRIQPPKGDRPARVGSQNPQGLEQYITL
ncbi:hypothetical protein PS691_01576 [Pseudomonas fluorescens]|uniref:Uncharacterized protein n=1 Tax=Pseudomonas fluorescens TaxID=294 RepID=A0A5E7BDH0_PSEFL|nr:hypothetical protein PS691_01576 [Pseudomonas fluorescens]